MNKLNTMSLCSPINTREYIWVGEYLDGTLFSEFNFNDGEPNDFYDIKKDQLLNYGLVGMGNQFYYNTTNGTFKINNEEFDFVYKTENKTYNLTKQSEVKYNDIIQFKKAVADFNPFGDSGGKTKGNIIGYNFGYKIELLINDITFNFKVIYKIDLEQNEKYFNITLVSNTDLEGELIILKNNKEVFKKEAPLQKNIGGEINWSTYSQGKNEGIK